MSDLKSWWRWEENRKLVKVAAWNLYRFVLLPLFYISSIIYLSIKVESFDQTNMTLGYIMGLAWIWLVTILLDLREMYRNA